MLKAYNVKKLTILSLCLLTKSLYSSLPDKNLQDNITICATSEYISSSTNQPIDSGALTYLLEATISKKNCYTTIKDFLSKDHPAEASFPIPESRKYGMLNPEITILDNEMIKIYANITDQHDTLLLLKHLEEITRPFLESQETITPSHKPLNLNKKNFESIPGTPSKRGFLVDWRKLHRTKGN